MYRLAYGYRMEDGRIVLDSIAAGRVLRFFEEYTGGLSIDRAGRSAGIPLSTGGLKGILGNRTYLGDDLHPRIVDDGLFRKANAERERRKTLLNGRNRCKPEQVFPVCRSFRICNPRTVSASSPKERAEILYAMISKEVEYGRKSDEGFCDSRTHSETGQA